MKYDNIMSLINQSSDEFDLEIAHIISSDPSYIKAESDFYEAIQYFETPTKLRLDTDAVTMETVARNTAFNEGFKLAVKLIFSSIKECEKA